MSCLPSVLTSVARDVSKIGAQAKSTAVASDIDSVKTRTEPSTTTSATPVISNGATLASSGTVA